MLKLIHGADFHLDSPFSGLSPERAAQRRSEQRSLLDDLARLVRQKGADLVLLSGDLFDSHQIYRETAAALMSALGGLPCPVFIAPGNHDCRTDTSPYASLRWPDNVHIFSTNSMERVDLPGLGCAVWGGAFPEPHLDRSPLSGFSAPADGLIHLGVLHADVEGGPGYGPITREDIAASGLHYLALGHIHQWSGLQKAGRTHWAYPGCPEGRGFDETGEKGVLYVEVSPDRVDAQLIPLARRRYQILSVDLTGQEDPLAAVVGALPARTQDDIYRILLTGQAAAPDLGRLERALSPRFYGLTLRDRTRLPVDIWARRSEDSLTGIFLQLMWEKCQADPDNIPLQQAVRFGLAALEQGEDPYL